MPTGNRVVVFVVIGLLAVAAFGLLAGRAPQRAPVTVASKALIVSGDSQDVARFTKLALKWHPSVAIVSSASQSDSQSRVQLRLPSETTSAQVLEITRHALLADLAYKYQDYRRVSG